MGAAESTRSRTPAEKPVYILHVEDNPAHAEFVRRILLDQRPDLRIHLVTDGEQALDYLLRRGRFVDPEASPEPRLILLDLRLPKVSGLQVLEEIRKQADLHRIPVVVLTSSSAESDAMTAYSRCANSYLVKPADFDEFVSLVKDLGQYWMVRNLDLAGGSHS